MTNSMKSICIAAAVAGMLGGVPLVSNAQPVAGHLLSENLINAVLPDGRPDAGRAPLRGVLSLRVVLPLVAKKIVPTIGRTT